MEISNLTICRQDVIVLSDTDGESKCVNSNKKKKYKRKTTCIRNVKIKTAKVNRIVPCCSRLRCRRAQHYQEKTSINTKYHKKQSTAMKIKYNNKEKLFKSPKNTNNIDMVLSTDLYSPITIASSSDTYENISSCSFDIASSDSDELEDLINLTRKRMKNERNFNSFSITKSLYAPKTQNDYQSISSDDDILNGSIHSLETVLLYAGNTDPCLTPPENQPNDYNNVDVDSEFMCRINKQDSNKLLQKKIPSLACQNNNNLTPLYEISEKVLMENYLNTRFI